MTEGNYSTRDNQVKILATFRKGFMSSWLPNQGILFSFGIFSLFSFLPCLHVVIIISFTLLVLFLALSTTCEPEELVRILNDLFALFDKLASVSVKLKDTVEN